MSTALEILQANGIVNGADLIVAAELEHLPLYVAVGFAVKESGGQNVYGHDPGGAMFGAGQVTENNFAAFTALVAAGAQSNGVGPLQITWPGFFPDAANQGLRLWVPLDNFRYGFRLIRSYLADESDQSIIDAGTRYNGATIYGQTLLPIARQWQQLLATAIGGTGMTLNTAAQAVARSRSWGHYTPKGMCAEHVSNSLSNGTLPYWQVDNANTAWNLAQHKHYDRNFPAGVPVYFGPNHITIGVENGRVRSTDYHQDTVMGECTVDEMCARWPGLFYRGWSEDFAGDRVSGLVLRPAPSVAHPSNSGGSGRGGWATNKPRQNVTIRVSDLKPGARNQSAIDYNRVLWAAQGSSYRAAHQAMWNAGSANQYDWAAACITYDTYVWLHNTFRGDPRWSQVPTHSKSDWATPGRELLLFLGATPA